MTDSRILSDAESRLPKYIQIREQIRSEILENGLDGKQYTVVSLAIRFGDNRLTARHAIEGLIQEGLIQSVKGVGVFASPSRTIVENINEPSNFLYKYYQEGRDAKIQTRTIEWMYADPEVAKNLMVRRGTKVLFIERLRSTDGVPLTLDYKYVRTPWANVLNAEVLQTGMLRKILEKEAGVRWHGMSNQIEAIPAPAKIAACLNIDEGSPVVVRNVVMYTENKSVAVTFGVSYYRADRFKWQSYIEF
jgi:GntR family transcriptional regulator